jgi:phosphopantetheinyl transferase
LLNYALQKEFKYDIVKQKNFKLINKCFWKYKNYFFSITHRDEYVAIAISMHKIGVDLELFNKKLFNKNI